MAISTQASLEVSSIILHVLLNRFNGDKEFCSGKWKSQTRTGHRHGLGSGGHDSLPVIIAVCKQDRLLHVCSTLHFVALSLTRYS